MDISAVKLGKEALDDIVVPMSNNEGGLHPFIDTHRDTSGSNIVKSSDICYSKKTYCEGRERKIHECGGTFPRFACAGISISAFLHIAIFVHICSSSPTDLQGVLFFLHVSLYRVI